MNSPHPWRALTALALAVTLASCSKSTSPVAGGGSASAEQLAVATAISGTSGILTDSLLDQITTPAALDAQPVAGGLAGSASVQAAITPRMWWRTVHETSASFTYAFSDSDSTGRPRQADLVVTRQLAGTLHIFKALPTDSTRLDSTDIVTKPIADTWVRHVRLNRVAATGSAHTAWRVTGASVAQVTSPGTGEQILSVRLQATGIDTTVADPTALWQFHQLFHMLAGDSVTVTATTTHTNDVVLCYWHDRRERFHSNGDGTYTYKLRLPALEHGGERFIGVTALSHGTLYDNATAYDSFAWAFHCFVGGRPAGAYY